MSRAALFVGLAFVLAALVASLFGVRVFPNDEQHPPHVRPAESGWAISTDYPDALIALENARDAWISNEQRLADERQEQEAAALADLARRGAVRSGGGVVVAGDAAACTRAHESDTAGGYGAYNPAGPYYGAYQFLQSTWDNTVAAMGRPDLVGVRPSDASPADQDAAFWFLWAGGAGASHFGGRCA